MKKFLYGVLGYIILPFLFIFFFIYGLCYILGSVCDRIKKWFEIFIKWVDKNITSKIR
jgi:hypothetical protein